MLTSHTIAHDHQVHGGVGGDADELRILSVNGTVLNVRGHGGSLSFHNTKVGTVMLVRGYLMNVA